MKKRSFLDVVGMTNFLAVFVVGAGLVFPLGVAEALMVDLDVERRRPTLTETVTVAAHEQPCARADLS